METGLFDANDTRDLPSVQSLLDAWWQPMPHEDSGRDMERRLLSVAQRVRDYVPTLPVQHGQLGTPEGAPAMSELDDRDEVMPLDHLLSGGPGPLWGAGWEAGIEAQRDADWQVYIEDITSLRQLLALAQERGAAWQKQWETTMAHLEEAQARIAPLEHQP